MPTSYLDKFQLRPTLAFLFKNRAFLIKVNATYMQISDLKIGDRGIILRCTSDRINSKLLCMGVKPGTPVTLLRKTNFGNTFYIKIGNSRMAIRAEEAQHIEITH